MADDDSKTEEPTQKKLDKTREEGQFARSQDLSVAMLMIAVAALLLFMGNDLTSNLLAALQKAFVFDSSIVADSSQVAVFSFDLLIQCLIIISPVFVVTIIFAFASAFFVGGIGFSMKGFMPKASKLNPLQGLGRMFGVKSVVELTKGLLKLALIGTVIYFVVALNFDEIFTLGILPPNTATPEGLRILVVGIFAISLSLLVIAAIDVPYQMVSFRNKLKMSIQDIKDEYKDSEGRPEVKAKIRQKQREIAMSQMMEAIKDADVIVTNPTHFAVALSYAVGTQDAPRVVAKGADIVAQNIRERAKQEGVTLFEEPVLARALFFTTEIDQDIPRPLFEAVAEVIAYVFHLNSFGKNGRGVKKPRVSIPPSMQFDYNGQQLNER
ncbi:flagellar biosynthesis protein FlhB [Gammaproteobacteria bacterium]|jgi:flagellar biosynthetic protein FlhB|nr:flagellar biosynthesis protein FlhB [Gammaproteobacteria bacterium]MDP4745613.1 flagellar biosynthesis protein FlhB [Porticoccaceae bacterium]MDP4942424.1 flagellar biosynthesis protein FlhB [OM182 bacterium]MDA8601648.1 flagellar biosynthesis protein FlhB [Gammaproteobacteria bacterium]MDA9185027.1 flagellar biosynthesis protein FlhB [Gammaproteobacteria bacterium]